MDRKVISTPCVSRVLAIAAVSAGLAVTAHAQGATQVGGVGGSHRDAQTIAASSRSVGEPLTGARTNEVIVARSFDENPITAAVRAYRATGVAHPVAQGSFTAYPFGHSAPVLTCSVLRACVVELEAGERLTSEPIAGDQYRWLIDTARTGPSGRVALVVVKAKDCDIATNLVIPTDRRVYDVAVDAPPCARRSTNGRGATVQHVRFYYPDDTTASEPTEVADGEANVRAAVCETAPAGAPRNTSYRIRRERGRLGFRKPLRFPWRPEAMWDDGAHLHVALPVVARQHAAPVLYAVEPDGSRTVLNYVLRPNAGPSGADLIVADRVVRRAALVVAAGGERQALELENRGWGRVLAARAGETTGAPGCAGPVNQRDGGR